MCPVRISYLYWQIWCKCWHYILLTRARFTTSTPICIFTRVSLAHAGQLHALSVFREMDLLLLLRGTCHLEEIDCTTLFEIFGKLQSIKFNIMINDKESLLWTQTFKLTSQAMWQCRMTIGHQGLVVLLFLNEAQSQGLTLLISGTAQPSQLVQEIRCLTFLLSLWEKVIINCHSPTKTST